MRVKTCDTASNANEKGNFLDYSERSSKYPQQDFCSKLLCVFFVFLDSPISFLSIRAM